MPRTETTSPLKIGIPIRSHWIGEIGAGRKDWELRSRPLKTPVTIGLIESGTGCVVGVADITACHGPLTFKDLLASRSRHQVPEGLLKQSTYKETYAYELTKVRWFAVPVPYTHKSGAVTSVRFDPPDQRALARAMPMARPVRRRPGRLPSPRTIRHGKGLAGSKTLSKAVPERARR